MAVCAKNGIFSNAYGILVFHLRSPLLPYSILCLLHVSMQYINLLSGLDVLAVFEIHLSCIYRKMPTRNHALPPSHI